MSRPGGLGGGKAHIRLWPVWLVVLVTGLAGTSGCGGCGGCSLDYGGNSSGCGSGYDEDASEGEDSEGGSGNAAPLSFQVTSERVWPLVDVYPGATSVSRTRLRARGLHWSIFGWQNGQANSELARPAASVATLTESATGVEVPIELDLVDVRSGEGHFEPVTPLSEETEYILAFVGCPFMPHVFCPDPVRFSTTVRPRVVGLWRVGTSFMVAFSEPMDAESLALAPDGLDLLFSDNGVLRSVASDLPLFQFAWGTEGARHTVGPISEAPFWLQLGPRVRSAKGQPLDPNAQGMLSEATFAVPVIPQYLPACYVRQDFPDPCVRSQQLDWDEVTFIAPFIPQLGVTQ